jgi:transcriptional regulator with XRE-family HTH domain
MTESTQTPLARGPKPNRRLDRFDEALATIKAAREVTAVARALKVSRQSVIAWTRGDSTPPRAKQLAVLYAARHLVPAKRALTLAHTGYKTACTTLAAQAKAIEDEAREVTREEVEAALKEVAAERGRRAALAKALGVSTPSPTRWVKGECFPDPKHWAGIVRFVKSLQ